MSEPTTSSPKLDGALRVATKVVFFFSGLFCLVLGWIDGAQQNVSYTWAFMTLGILFFFAAAIDQFEIIKIPGLYAKTRKLDKKISEANEALRRIRQLAEITAGALVEVRSKMGRWSSATDPGELYHYGREVVLVLEKLGSPTAKRRKAFSPCALMLSVDLTQAFFESFAKKHLEARRMMLSTEISSFSQPVSANDAKYRELLETRDRLDQCANEKLGVLARTNLKDFEHAFVSYVKEVESIAGTNTEMADNARYFANAMRALAADDLDFNFERAFAAIREQRK